MASCSREPEYSGWTTVPVKNPPAKVSFNDVLVIDQTPNAAYTKVGYITPPADSIIRVSFGDANLLQYFKKQAANIGANTVVLRNSPIEYKSGMAKSTSVDLLYISDEGGSHGGDELNIADKSLDNGDFLNIY